MKEVDVVIIGAGPTGLFTALNIYNKSVLLIDARQEIGGKIKVSGGGRCNIGNNKSIDEFLKNIYKNEKFLYPTFNNHSPQDVLEYFVDEGIKLKEESDNKMFPANNNSETFVKYFEDKLYAKENVNMLLGYEVSNIEKVDGKFIIDDKYKCKYLVMATGGVSYPHISFGYVGHEMLKDLGHSITDLKPASTPLVVTSDLISSRALQGITLIEATGEVYINGKKKKTLQKDLLITHFGLSGPLALDLSCFIKENLDRKKEVELKVILEDIPKKIKPYLEEDDSITFKISDVKGFKVAFVTNGGISLKEVSPQDLQSKIVDNLYIGGEILDLHAITGGYNISTCLCEGKLIGGKINER